MLHSETTEWEAPVKLNGANGVKNTHNDRSHGDLYGRHNSLIAVLELNQETNEPMTDENENRQ